jgi:hypothetical protein
MAQPLSGLSASITECSPTGIHDSLEDTAVITNRGCSGDHGQSTCVRCEPHGF